MNIMNTTGDIAFGDNNPEKSWTVSIGSSQDIIDVYGKFFDEIGYEGFNNTFYLETKYPTDMMNQPRFFIGSTVCASIKSEDINVWNLDEKDIDLFKKIYGDIIPTRIKNKVNNKEFEISIKTNEGIVIVTYHPFTPETSEYLQKVFDEREKLLHKQY